MKIGMQEWAARSAAVLGFIGDPPEALSTNCGGQGVTVFFGMAKPVRAPQIGPARAF
jgi:hypothetical protein